MTTGSGVVVVRRWFGSRRASRRLVVVLAEVEAAQAAARVRDTLALAA